MKNKHTVTVAVIAMLLAVAVTGSYALLNFQSTITNNSNLDLTAIVDQVVGTNVFQVLRTSAVTITYNLLSTLLGLPWVITSTTGGVLRQLSIPSVPLGANITIAANYDVFVNGIISGPLALV